jgi:ABC-type antimicrobial peptide transport system permease subunit
MTFSRLVLRNLLYHWRGNLAVLLGVALGSAVLTGALLVGDSLQRSLRDRALGQLDWVDHAMVSGHFFREELARDLGIEKACPAIFLRGSLNLQRWVIRLENGDRLRLNKNDKGHVSQVNIWGVDDQFWLNGLSPHDDTWPHGIFTRSGVGFWSGEQPKAVLNQALADGIDAFSNLPLKEQEDALHQEPSENVELSVEHRITVHLQTVSDIPHESFLGRRDTDEFQLEEQMVIPNDGLGRFSVFPNTTTPRNLFVPLRALQRALKQHGKVNAILLGSGAADLPDILSRHLTLDDWGLTLRPAKDHGYLSLQSRELLLSQAVTDAATAAAKEMGLPVAPTLVYLANTISDGKNEIPYSVVAALDPTLPPPLGPFLPTDVALLKDDEIILVDWKESPLKVQPGSQITVTYFPPDETDLSHERTARFTVRGFLPIAGAADDPGLTPEFPGITDRLDIRKWDPPFPYHNERVKPRDERYWKEHKATPKAYITLAAGQKLWGSRFGNLTSIRLALKGATENQSQDGPSNQSTSSKVPIRNIAAVKDKYARHLLAQLRPEQGGFVVDDVRQRALAGSAGSTDFRWLFLGFSIFLIAAGILLVALLFRLHLDRRGPEIGVLSAVGHRLRTIRWLLLAEGGIVAACGACLGLIAALVYGWLVLQLFKAWWPGELDRSFLRLHPSNSLTFIYGFVASWLMGMAAIANTVRKLGRVSTPGLLAGETEPTAASVSARVKRRSPIVLGIAALWTIVLIVMAVMGVPLSAETRAMLFFLTGILFLILGITALRDLLRIVVYAVQVVVRGKPRIGRLGFRNAGRHPARSILTAGLISSATFLIVAVESFHKSPPGASGVSLIAESDLPVYQDLNAAYPRDDSTIPSATRVALSETRFSAFRLRSGDDTSCLNLYLPRKPRILGVPASFDGTFAFKEPATAEVRKAPRTYWKLLEQSLGDDIIPAIADANTAEWVLHLKVGQDRVIQDERGNPVYLRLVATLQDSIFQSELLISEANFLKLFPHEEGYRFFLVSTPSANERKVKSILETDFADRGVAVTPAAERLESYLAVENTYLMTFQALGGLGLVLGALGLGIVLVRTVWERRGELAILRALGFRESALGRLILVENAFLLLLGLVIGTLAAMITVLPQLVAGTAQLPWWRLAVLLLVVLVVGIAAGWAALISSLKAPLLQSLRRE